MKMTGKVVSYNIELTEYELKLIVDALATDFRMSEEDALRYREIEDRRDEVAILGINLADLLGRDFVKEATDYE